MEVRLVDRVVVDQADGADSACGQVQGARRAETPCADQQHPAVEQLALALLPNLGDQELSRVAALLRGGQERLGCLPVAAQPSPVQRGALHAHGVGVAQGLHARHGTSRSRPGGAVDEQRGGLVGNDRLDAAKDVAERHERGRRDVPFVPLELLANVDDPVSRLGEAQRVGDDHLADLGLGRGLIGHGLPC